MASSSQCVTFVGPWTSCDSNKILSLEFIAKYTTKVDSLDFSGDFINWYAPGAKFYDKDKTVYSGGEAIWEWMRGPLFGSFQKMHHEILVTRVIAPDVREVGPEGHLLIMEVVTSFWLKGDLASPEPITVPRLLSFRVGASEGDSDGTNGLQILEAKAWWDRTVLMKEITKRKASENS